MCAYANALLLLFIMRTGRQERGWLADDESPLEGVQETPSPTK